MQEKRIYRQDRASRLLPVASRVVHAGGVAIDIHRFGSGCSSSRIRPIWASVPFTISEEEVLLSYASVMRLSLPHAGGAARRLWPGQRLHIPALPGQKAYGRQVVEMATRFSKTATPISAALFRNPGLERFTPRCSWETPPGAITHIGTPERRSVNTRSSG